MKNILILSFLFSICIFTSSDNDLIDDDYSLVHEETEYIGEVNFTVDNQDNTILEKDDLLLTNNSINAVSYHWDFGNGDTSSEAQPYYHYDIHGYYTVTLTITDTQGKTFEKSEEILILCLFGGLDHDS